MSFFLLVRRDDSLELLSSQLFATRQDALAYLAELTSDVDFDAWDDEVLVADTDVAAPVLLVRPAAAPAPVVVEPTSELESAFVVEADEPVFAEEAATLPAPVDFTQTAVEPEPLPEPLAPVEDAWAEAIAETIDADDDDLRAALSRTTEVMLAEGVPVIESVDIPDPAPSEATAVPSAAAAEPMSQLEPTMPAPLELEPEPVEIDELTEEVPEPTPVIDAPPAAFDAWQPSAEEPATAWPWDGPAPQAPVAVETNALGSETPVIDTMAVDSLAEPEDVMTAPAAEAVVEPEPAPEIEPEPAPEIEPALEPEPEVVVPAPGPEPEVVVLTPEPEPAIEAPMVDFAAPSEAAAEPESDFILDLDDEPAVAIPPGYSAPSDSDVDISGMTCNDCVYVSTCPNKDERDPSSCGSFQWK